MARTYSDAIASLNTLQSNFAIVDAIRKSGRLLNEQSIPEMTDWCKRIGYDLSSFDKLNAIHIAGTKGKGSTAAFISSILTQYIGQRSNTTGRVLAKVGLYTSPHLRFVRERIQINGQPLSEEQFAKYFFDVWDRLDRWSEAAGLDPRTAGSKPVYFRYLTLMAFHVYISEGVDTAIIECGIGGTYDSTNVLQTPSVTAITSLGIDHVGMLGNTLPEIAWHKSGIMKKGSRCFTTTSQKPEAKEVMDKVASEKGVGLDYVDVEPGIQNRQTKLGLQAEFQKINASIAVAVAKEWLSKFGYDVDMKKTATGLEQTKWGGRCETRLEKDITWCIDGGHTMDSIELAGQWFAGILHAQQRETEKRTRSRFLIFNQQTRDADALAMALYKTLASAVKDQKPFTHAIFCTNTTFKETGFRPDLVSLNQDVSKVEELTVQKQLAETWHNLDADAEIHVAKTIEEATELVRATAKETGHEVTALVTGSLHLVGGFLEVLDGSH